MNDSVRSTVERKRFQAGVLLLILLLATGLRFYRLDAQSLWNDEGTSVAMAQRDLATIARDAAQDIHPPLYYWLLHGWVRLLGTSEVAVRSLSALLGVVLVALIYALGRLLAGPWAGLAAALLAAANPFQVYYSQEARMYMLLAVWSALLFYAALRWADTESGDRLRWGAVYVLAGAAGMYTHYAFPLVLLAVNLAMLLLIGYKWEARSWAWQIRPWWRWLLEWIGLQVAVGLLFVPWLPTAYRQLTTWPGSTAPLDLVAAIKQIFVLLAAGPGAPPSGLDELAVLLLLVLFYVPPKRSRWPSLVLQLAPVVWLVVPIVLILALGLYKEAYLKFLLVTSPAFCLLVGRVVAACGRQTWAMARKEGTRENAVPVILLVLLLPFLYYVSVSGLGDYFTDPARARDDYRSIAAYVEALGRPGDAVLLDAPGQQEVFDYYYHGTLPVYPLPESRPPDPAATEAALQQMVRPGSRVFAVLWATDESDPQRLIEGWLDAHTYKALDSWYGNVRLAVYAVPEQTPATPDRVLNVPLRNAGTGDEITLLGYSLLSDHLAAGDLAQITLFWQAGQVPGQRYKVFIHVLDTNNHIVGQRDAEPGGGARLTTLWAAGETVADNYGLPIHPATPPGEYRVEVGMYSLDTGERLLAPGGASQVWLAPLTVERPAAPAPLLALGMQHSTGKGFGDLALLGYDAYKLGFSQQPDAPLRPGDVLQANLYWRAAARPTGDWRLRIALVDRQGQPWVNIEAEPVAGYATSAWQAGDVWRGQFDLAIPGDVPVGNYRLQVQPIPPAGLAPEPFLSAPLAVER